jgi:hypothetical protein
MIYKRSYLASIERSKEEAHAAMQTLVNALINGQQLTLSEGRFLGGFLEIAQTDDPEFLDKLYNQLPGYHFWQLHLKYAMDINGEGGIRTPYGYLSQDQKMLDAGFWDGIYQDWRPFVYKLKHKYTELQFLTSEARKDMKATLDFNQRIGAGSRRMIVIEKTLILHSKFVFSKIEEYYQEYQLKKDTIMLCGKEIVVDSYTYAHAGIRHMAPWTKFGRTDKTFHGAEIDINNLPRVIIDFMEDYERYMGCGSFDERRIYFRYKNRNNVIKLEELSRPVKGGTLLYYLRVQSFYPAELREDAERVNNLTLTMVSDDLGFLVNTVFCKRDSSGILRSRYSV